MTVAPAARPRGTCPSLRKCPRHRRTYPAVAVGRARPPRLRPGSRVRLAARRVGGRAKNSAGGEAPGGWVVAPDNVPEWGEKTVVMRRRSRPGTPRLTPL